MNSKKILPPTYLFVSIMVMLALHVCLPGKTIISSPYRYLGAVPVMAGLLISIWASNSFDKAGTTVKPFEKSTFLVTTGVYRFSRHPMYLGMVLLLLGLAVLLGTIIPVPVVLVFFWLMHTKFVNIEEKAMEETFGDEYLEYKRRVRCWI